MLYLPGSPAVCPNVKPRTSSPRSGWLGSAPAGARPTRPTRSAPTGNVATLADGVGVADLGWSAGLLALCPSRVPTTPATATNRPSPATTANVASRSFRLALLWRCCCSSQGSTSSSTRRVVISNRSFTSCIWTSGDPEYGSALRSERADGRGSNAHDPRGLLRAVAVHVEQDEGCSLSGGELEQHLSKVLP